MKLRSLAFGFSQPVAYHYKRQWISLACTVWGGIALAGCGGGTNGLAPTNPEPTLNAVSSATPPPNSLLGKIVFVSSRDGTNEIYTMNPDGSNITRVSRNQNPGEDTQPSISWDRRKIAFVSQRGGATGLYLANIDGSGLTQLTSGIGVANPAFSPDGRKIAFTSFHDVIEGGGIPNRIQVSEIDILNIADKHITPITGPPSASVYDDDPAWSPDGRKLAFDSSRPSGTGIYIMNANGTGITPLGIGAAGGKNPAFSSDGRKIAFVSARADPFGDIYSMDSNGRNVKRLTKSTTADLYPAFSPDSRKIVFAAQRNAKSAIYVMNADGTQQTRITSDTTYNALPDWR